MKVYLAGPMTGISYYNFPAFDEAAMWLENRGYTVVSPAELDGELGIEPDEEGKPLPPEKYEELLTRDLAMIESAAVQAVVVLEEWHESQGARREVARALELGLPVMTLDTALQYPPRHPSSERVHTILRQLGTLHDLKQRDYGRENDPFANVRASEEWGIKPWVGALIRATDKLRRLQTYAKTGKLANEGVVDAFDDLAVYAVIGRVLFEEGPDGF